MKACVFTMMGLAFMLTGCTAGAIGFQNSGENASYSADNWTKGTIQSMKVYGTGNIFRLYDSASEIPPHFNPTDKVQISNFQPIPGVGGNQFMADTGHRIPEEVEAQWRRMPPPGGKNYTGELVGPLRVKVRERIPPEVLLVARKRGMNIGIELGLTESRIWVNWGVVDFNRRKGTGIVGIVRLCVGGDSYTDAIRTSLPPPFDGEPAIGVWPNCKFD